MHQKYDHLKYVSHWTNLPAIYNHFVGETKVISMDDMVYSSCELYEMGKKHDSMELDQVISSACTANHLLKNIMIKVISEDS